MNLRFFIVISIFTLEGLIFLPSCTSKINTPSAPAGITITPTPTSTFTDSTTPTGSATSTPTGSLTPTHTATWTLTGSNTSTKTATPTGSTTPTPTPSLILTGSPTSTSTFTSTASATSTATATGTVASCSTTVSWGDTATGGSGFSMGGQTQAQQYVLAQASTVQKIWLQLVGPSTVKVGIYSNYGTGTWPGTLLYVSAPQTLASGLNAITIPNIYLAAGTYWLAYSGVNLAAASGSTALRAWINMDFPCQWLACGYTSCSPPTCPAGATPTCTPTVLCTPPPSGVGNSEGVIYAGVCY